MNFVKIINLDKWMLLFHTQSYAYEFFLRFESAKIVQIINALRFLAVMQRD